MTIRERLEENECLFLSPYAALSANTRGRRREEEPCDMRTAYQRDRDRILHSKAFRRLKHKTQVFLAPEGDHYRTRLTHTLEVSQIARSISRALGPNEDLTEAIALGHDLGHTPFGHAGENELNALCPEGFSHAEQSVRIVEILEKKGRGLNLTFEVLDGILNHRTSGSPMTMEGKVVRRADKIAYISHDVDDAIRGGILKEEQLPEECRDVLGGTVRERLNTMIHDLIENSMDKPEIRLSLPVEAAMNRLRQFLFEELYLDSISKQEDGKAKDLIRSLFYYYVDHPEELPEELILRQRMGLDGRERIICDYIAGMTDVYAINRFKELYVPENWKL